MKIYYSTGIVCTIDQFLPINILKPDKKANSEIKRLSVEKVNSQNSKKNLNEITEKNSHQSTLSNLISKF